ncbi:MAG: UbiX family flavin prenyltransferase [Candidatus Thermoplasmatota archaeon]|jgi:4-hydroxy-3-polyprenylbenzoate decarboxylase|nr:UbiX family flavin prenyltransferase [Candidatus Thermoplasmatota archaeon]MDA8144408.1 UbiX family flavin prenyltransferase [Thermoplasmatales archaeon]
MKRRIVVCITGSTGAIYGTRLLQACSKIENLETHAVISSAAEATIRLELHKEREEVEKMATYAYSEYDFEAPIASGSFITDSMIVAPCSMKTLSSIATGFEQNLVTRAAMVALKERRPLILLTRETPLNLIQLRNMVQVTEAGGIIMPPLPPLYFEPKNMVELADLTVGRVLNMVGVKTDLLREWGKEKLTD